MDRRLSSPGVPPKGNPSQRGLKTLLVLWLLSGLGLLVLFGPGGGGSSLEASRGMTPSPPPGEGRIGGPAQGTSSSIGELDAALAAAEERLVPDGSPSVEESEEAVAVPTEEVSMDEFRALVSETLGDVRRQKATDMRLRLEGTRNSLEDTLDSMATLLELTPGQVTRMRSVLLTRIECDEEYIRLWETGVDENDLADLKDRDRRKQLREVASFLDAGQVRAFGGLEP